MKERAPLSISVRNLQRALPVNLRRLRKFCAWALPRCLAANSDAATELRKLDEVSILLVSDKRMSAIHSEFLGQEGPTDVITFDHGEIFISVPTAKANAGTFKTSLHEELELYMVHGLLHLNGFDDRTAAQARVMGHTQRRILRAAGKPSPRHAR